MTVALCLPDGRAAFMYRRPEISENDALAAGGLSIEVAKPFEDLVVSCDGEVLILEEPMDMLDPKATFANSPREQCRVKINHADAAPAWGGELEARDDSDTALADFWKGMCPIRGPLLPFRARTRGGDAECALRGDRSGVRRGIHEFHRTAGRAALAHRIARRLDVCAACGRHAQRGELK